MNEKQRFCLPEPMKSRYTGYPESWVEFVSIVKSMIRGDDQRGDSFIEKMNVETHLLDNDKTIYGIGEE